MLRYMICPVIGDGLTLNTGFRAAVSDLANVNLSQVIPTHASGPNIGKPKYLFAFCQVATTSIVSISAVTNSYVFPDYPLDAQMSGMEAAVRTALEQSVEAFNLDGNGLHFDASNVDLESYRTVLNRIVQQIEPSFNVNNMNVSEVVPE